MARKPDIQYVRYYTDGSAARQLEILSPQKTKTTYPRTRRKKGYVIYVDPLAICSIVLAMVLLVCMVMGTLQIQSAWKDLETANRYVYNLADFAIAAGGVLWTLGRKKK